MRRIALEMEAQASGRGLPNPFIAALFYFPVSIRQIYIAFREGGWSTRKNFRVGYSRQFADLLYLCWRLNHSPHDYYQQKMWLRPSRKSWSQYLQQREHVAFVTRLQRSLPMERFDDKLELFRHLHAAGIPTIEVFLAAVNGRWLEPFIPRLDDARLRRDLVIKPTNGTMYDGVEIWHYDPQTDTYRPELFTKVNGIEARMVDEKLPLSALLARVLSLAAQRSYIVQPCVKNNPALDPISPHMVANFRIVTARHQDRGKVIAALLRLGYDNLKYIPGTYQANVDLETGVLGVATGRHVQWGFGEHHIETGHRVTGYRIENWAQLKAIALRGHDQYPWMPTIGWDAIDSDRGPLLMEANAFWGADIVQLDCQFIGESGYAEACLEAYERE